MSSTRLIIDGYSLIHRDPELKRIVGENLQRAREMLIDRVSRIATSMAGSITIVFDGQGHGGADHTHIGAVEIIYSKPGQTADTVIERLVHLAPDPANWIVVTNDRRERETVMAAGAQSMSCAVFLEECGRTRRHHEQSFRRAALRTPGNRLGDFFPDDM